MIPSAVLLASLLGIMLNLAEAGLLLQPDWSAGILVAAILAHRSNWVWALPGLWVHDLALHWSSFVCLPLAVLLPWLMMRIDEQIGPALPQRMALMLLTLSPLLWFDWGVSQWLLTNLVCIAVWYMMTRYYAEPV